MKYLFIIVTTLSMLMCSFYPQTKTIKGRVISNDFETMPGVSILINDTIKVGRTDLNGFFRIQVPVSEKKILFKGIGLNPTTIELVDNCNSIEIIMMLSGTDDFIF